MSEAVRDDRDRAIAGFFKALTKIVDSVQPLVNQAIKDQERKAKG